MIDSQNMADVLSKIPAQCEEALELGKGIEIEGPFDSFVFCGMGGSGVTGDLMRSYLPTDKPVYVVKDYSLPKYVTSKSLVFCVSYSGNTEETVSAYRNARKVGAKIVLVSTGGKLEELANLNDTPLIKVPSGLPPRLSTGYMTLPILNVLMKNGQITDVSKDIEGMIKALKRDIYQAPAKELAKKLKFKIPIIYSSTRLGIIANKWKTDINENAKVHAMANVFPELNHNEINGYVNLNGSFYVVMIHDDEDTKEIQKRMKISKELIKKKGVSVTETAITGDNLLTKIFSSFYLGLWISYFLALEYETDPTPVEIIEDLKRELKK